MEAAEHHRSADRSAALLVGLPALLELALILHHPAPGQTGPATGLADRLSEIAVVIEANRTFHAILILLLVAQLTGLMLLARRLGLHRPPVVLGTVLFGLGGVLLLLATTQDGFVTFELISRCRASAAGCTESTAQGLRIVLASIQAFTKLGLVAQSLGFAALAGSLMAANPRLRLFGMAGLVIALAPLGLLASGAYIGPALILQVLIAHALLGVGAAFLLLSGHIDPAVKAAAS